MRVPKFHTPVLLAFAAVPAIALPVWLEFLSANRPHSTSTGSDFILPRLHDGVTYFISEQDRLIALGLSLWLVLALFALVFHIGQVFHRPLLRMLRPPRDMRVVKEPHDTTDAHA